MQTKEVTRLNGVYKKLLSKVDIYEGFAKIIDPHTVEVRDVTDGSTQQFSTEKILVATGGRPIILDIPGKVCMHVSFNSNTQIYAPKMS